MKKIALVLSLCLALSACHAVPATKVDTSATQQTKVIALPAITQGTTKKTPLSWRRVKDKSGYSIAYPKEWFVASYNGTVNQIQNWNPATARSGGGLSPEHAKWDVYFGTKKFTSLQDLFIDADPQIQVVKIEKFTTQDKIDIYFLDTRTPDTTNNGSLIPGFRVAFVQENGNYFEWWSYYTSTQQAEILKEIALSIAK